MCVYHSFFFICFDICQGVVQAEDEKAEVPMQKVYLQQYTVSQTGTDSQKMN